MPTQKHIKTMKKSGMKPQLQQRALLAGMLVVLIWGAAFTMQKAIYEAFSPQGYLLGRTLLMSLCAAGLLIWRRSPLWPRLDRAEWRTLALTTATGAIGHILLVTYGLHWSTPFSGSLIMALGPVCTLVLLRVMRGLRLSGHQLLGVALAFTGVLVLMAEKLAGADVQASAGDLMMLLSVVSFSLYNIVGTPLVVRYGGAEVMGWSTLLAAPLMVLLGAGALKRVALEQIPTSAWLAFFWTVIVSGFTAWILWSWVNAVRGVARTALLLYGIPPVAGVIAAYTTGESFGWLKVTGAALALLGVALSQRVDKQSSSPGD
jgi:drug/metabolite transporter (DMT)-like permease